MRGCTATFINALTRRLERLSSRECSIAGILLSLSLATSLAFRARTLTTWDAVQFALAVREYNMLRHQPHPPGYILWVALLKGFNYLLNDPNTASIIINSILAGLTAYMIHYMLHNLYRYRVGYSFAVSILWLFNPVTWYYRSVAENYVVGAFYILITLLLLYKYMDNGKCSTLLLAVYIAGLAGGFRIEAPLIMIPNILFAVFKSRRLSIKLLSITVAIYVLGLATWFIPQIILCGGFTPWFIETTKLFSTRFRETAIGLAPMDRFYVNLRLATYTLLIGTGWSLLFIPLTIAYPILCLTRKVSLNRYSIPLITTSLIIYLFSALIHTGKTGYLLPATTLLTIELSRVFYIVVRSYWRVASITLALLALLNTCIYLTPEFDKPFTMIEDMRTHHSYHYIVLNDQALEYIASIIQRYSSNDTAVVVYDPARYVDWRKIMYYLPEYLAIHVHRVDGEKLVDIAQNYRYYSLEEVMDENITACIIVTSQPLETEIIGSINSATHIYRYSARNITECIDLLK